jgi:hypothetical protein
MPESCKSTQLSTVNDEDTMPLLDERSAPLASGLLRSSSEVGSISIALSNKNFLLALPVFLTGSLRFTILNVLIQYASNRFNLKISTGAFFYTETAIVNMLLFLFAVPILSSYLRTNYNINAQTIDLFMSRICVCFLCIGSLLIGLSSIVEFLPISR